MRTYNDKMTLLLLLISEADEGYAKELLIDILEDIRNIAQDEQDMSDYLDTLKEDLC